MKKYVFVTCVVVLAAGVATFLVSAKRNRMGASATTSAQPGNDKPLKDKAKRFRNFVDYQERSSATYQDLSGLARGSSAIIVATPNDNMSKLTSDGRSITLNYSVTVQYVYKGALNENGMVTVSIPGGRVKFANGGTAEIQTGWFKKMQPGKTYLLFLQSLPNSAFELTGEAQGVFEIPTSTGDRTVKSLSGVFGDPIWRYHGMDVKLFLREVRNSIKAG